MPGTIQVSVLGLVGLPSSSISVKVSMGKKEYQTWDKGEFCFPLTALRDNLIVTLHDAEGNELCVKEVETRLIVEKGNLDDILTLEGGVNLHLKYQFILTEEDRKRIREMRDSALRKKRGELIASSPTQSESESVCSIGGVVAMPSVSLNSVVTGSLLMFKSSIF
ncbi:hypothetical protein Scep_007734 [Stephania cephalantha]|uniref:Uncharacterized protein n=1 Tax=Stephania cephalantha TaxID=152367 RepID=A0AAP0KAN1_9MAGN